ncbi:MAG: hypothetical protein GY703_24395 [Gammaproteobacteria bacterium]|nr:hypothetical protein [Gammaproteobacteria bacterium]
MNIQKRQRIPVQIQGVSSGDGCTVHEAEDAKGAYTCFCSILSTTREICLEQLFSVTEITARFKD